VCAHSAKARKREKAALIGPLNRRGLTPCTFSGSEGRSLHDVLVDAILYIKALKARDEAAGTILCVCVVCVCLCVCVRGVCVCVCVCFLCLGVCMVCV